MTCDRLLFPWLFDPEASASLSPSRIAWHELFECAKRGEFAGLEKLLPFCYREGAGSLENCFLPAQDRSLLRASARLLQFAGSPELFDRLELVSRGVVDAELALPLARILLGTSGLRAVPLVIEIYRHGVWVSDLNGSLEMEFETCLGAIDKPKRSRDNYSKTLMLEYVDTLETRYLELTESFGTDRVFLVHGEIYSMVRIAELLLEKKQRGAYWEDLWLHLMAATGRSFSSDDAIRAFRDGPGSEFEPGVRHCYSHRLAGY